MLIYLNGTICIYKTKISFSNSKKNIIKDYFKIYRIAIIEGMVEVNNESEKKEKSLICFS